MPSYPAPFTGFSAAADAFGRSFNAARERKIQLTDILSREKIQMLKMEQEKIERAQGQPMRDAELRKTQAQATATERENLPFNPATATAKDEYRHAMSERIGVQLHRAAQGAAQEAISNLGIKTMTADDAVSAMIESRIDVPKVAPQKLKALMTTALLAYSKQPLDDPNKFKPLSDIISGFTKSFNIPTVQTPILKRIFNAGPDVPAYGPETKAQIGSAFQGAQADVGAAQGGGGPGLGTIDEGAADAAALDEGTDAGAAPAAPTTSGIPEGQTATHPTTKQKIIYRAGKWQAL
jgi:hypothetical protein